MSKPLLLILNPRRIPTCITALKALPIDKVWLSNYTEHELQTIIPNVIDTTTHDPIGVISDDTSPTPEALTAVLSILTPNTVTTGYCLLDEDSHLVNLSLTELTDPEPSVTAYTFPPRTVIQGSPHTHFRTYFAGHTLTFMHRHLWHRFPWRVFGEPPGCASDYMLSYRLQEAGIPIYAHPAAYVQHHKRGFNTLDTTPGRELLIGTEPAHTTWETT